MTQEVSQGDETCNEEGEDMDENDEQTLKQAKECHDHGESIMNTIKDPKKYEPYIESLTQSILKRETVLGRYNHITALSYAALGDIFLQMNEPRAVVMFRTCFRIHTFLYGKCNGHVSGALRDVLSKQRGLTSQEIDEVRADVLESMKYEMEGDLLRRYGDKKAAIKEYQKAAKVEEFAFGRDNPDLAYICRKMACLASIKKGVVLYHALDFDEADKLGHKWMKNAKEALNPPICAHIKKGDKYYESLLYGHAVSEYIRATMVEGSSTVHSSSESRKSPKPGKSKHKRSKSSSKREKQQNEDTTEEELRLLLAGKLPEKAKQETDIEETKTNKANKSEREMDTKISHNAATMKSSIREKESHQNLSENKTRQFQHSSAIVRHPMRRSSSSDQIKALYQLENSNKQLDATTDSDSSRKRSSSLDQMKAVSQGKSSSRDNNAIRRNSPVTDSSYRVSEKIKRFEGENKQSTIETSSTSFKKVSSSAVGVAPTTTTAPNKSPSALRHKSSSSPAQTTSKSARSSTPAPKSNMKRQTKKGGKDDLLESSSSIYDLVKPPSYLEPKKPKSDSYITKIAQTTTKIAKNHLRSHIQRSRSSSSKDQHGSSSKPKSASSFFGSLRKDRTMIFSSSKRSLDGHSIDKTKKDDNDDNHNDGDDNSTGDNKPLIGGHQSSNSLYQSLASPPMTPFCSTQHNDSDREIENFLKENFESASLSSFPLGIPLESPSGNETVPSISSKKQQKEFDDFHHHHIHHHQDDEWPQDDHYEDVDAESTEPLKLPEEETSVLENFFDGQEEQALTESFKMRRHNDHDHHGKQHLSSGGGGGDTQSVMTSDESIKERFLSETAQMTSDIINAEENDEEEPPSLVELVAHVQKMSALLQRQTFRLQHKLGDFSNNNNNSSSRTEGDIKNLPLDKLPQGTVELCKEVERLFEDCDEILAKAFSQLDANSNSDQHAGGGTVLLIDGKKKRRSKSYYTAIEEYRNTFALEKVFLNDLRKSVATVLANYSVDISSRVLGGNNNDYDTSGGDFSFATATSNDNYDEDDEDEQEEEGNNNNSQNYNTQRSVSSSSERGAMLFDLPGYSKNVSFNTTTTNTNKQGSKEQQQDSSSESIFTEDSMLSVVFEDNSNKSTSEQTTTKLQLM